MNISGTECARARESVSADLDRELLELDLRRLQAHLRVCPDCSAWAGSFRAAAEYLRAAPLETPSATVFEFPRRGRVPRLRPALVAAPAAALVAGVMVSLGVVHHGLFARLRTTSMPRALTDSHFVHPGPSIDMARLPVLHGMFRAV